MASNILSVLSRFISGAEGGSPSSTLSLLEHMVGQDQAQLSALGNAAIAMLSKPAAELEAAQRERAEDVFSLFYEHSGVVLLDHKPVDQDELKSYVSALDKFIFAHSINVHENVEHDERKCEFVAMVKGMRDAFVSDINSVIAIGKLLCKGMAAAIAEAPRPVSDDELIVKQTLLMRQLRKVCDALASTSRDAILRQQKTYLSGFTDREEKAARSAPVLLYGDGMFILEMSSKKGGRAKKPAASSKPVARPKKAAKKTKRSAPEPMDISSTSAEEEPRLRTVAPVVAPQFKRSRPTVCDMPPALPATVSTLPPPPPLLDFGSNEWRPGSDCVWTEPLSFFGGGDGLENMAIEFDGLELEY